MKEYIEIIYSKSLLHTHILTLHSDLDLPEGLPVAEPTNTFQNNYNTNNY